MTEIKIDGDDLVCMIIVIMMGLFFIAIVLK